MIPDMAHDIWLQVLSQNEQHFCREGVLGIPDLQPRDDAEIEEALQDGDIAETYDEDGKLCYVWGSEKVDSVVGNLHVLMMYN